MWLGIKLVTMLSCLCGNLFLRMCNTYIIAVVINARMFCLNFQLRNCDSFKENRRPVEILFNSRHLKTLTSDIPNKHISKLEVFHRLSDSSDKLFPYRKQRERLTTKS